VSDIQTSNRHAADRLYDTREIIRELEQQEEELRRYLLNHPHDRVGDQYHACVRPMSRRHVDVKSLAIEVGEAIMARHTSTRAVDVVRLSAVARPSRRRVKAA
jgi:hypothetical protein